jgi:YHS domain-containing protein
MRVAILGARHTVDHLGQTYYFCCPSCRRLFVADPDQYLHASHAGEPTDALPG